MDTRGVGTPIVVYTPRGRPVTELVEAWFPGKPEPSAVRTPKGAIVPADIVEKAPNRYKLSFRATVPAVGLAVFHVEPAGLKPTKDFQRPKELENDRLRVKVDANGDVVSVFDKKLNRETLKAPIRLQLLENVSPDWSAWEIKHETVAKKPIACVGAKQGLKKTFAGACRQTIEAKDFVEGSNFVKRISLQSGNSNRLDFEVEVDWASRGRLLKAEFPIRADKPKIVYDLGLGVIERGVNTTRLYEVPAQEWADLTDGSGRHGQWWSRLATGKFSEDPSKLGRPICKRAPLAHVFSHVNKPDGTFDAYKFAYLYRIDLSIKHGSKTLEWPFDQRVMLFAATLWNEASPVVAATPLYD